MVLRHPPQDASLSQFEAFRAQTRRRIRDLEQKGVTRTALETHNLADKGDVTDLPAAESICTFPRVTFSAHLLLERQKAEAGMSSVTATVALLCRQERGFKRSYTQSPLDLMSGFRLL